MLTVFLTLFVGLAQAPVQDDGKPCEAVDGGTHALPPAIRKVLSSRYRSWQVRHQCVGETENFDVDPQWASIASGDYDADGKVDHAVLLETRTPPRRTIIVVFLSSAGRVVVEDGRSYVSTINRGSRGHNFETEKDFTYETDAIFSSAYECCGFSLIWRNGRFIRIASSD